MWLTLLSPAADACVTVPPDAYETSDDAALVDHAPPAAPRVLSVVVTRAPEPVYHLEPDGTCTFRSSSCGGTGWVELVVEPPLDDHTPSDDLGYRAIPGWGPLGPPPQFLPAPDGRLTWSFADVASGPIDASLQVIAVDRAGNESEWSEVIEWSDPGRTYDTPCAEPGSLGCGAGGAAAWVGPVALGLRRRRRQG